MNRDTRIAILFPLALTAIALFVCIRIEVFNLRAGGYLPRSPDNDHGVSTWRVASPSEAKAEEWNRFRDFVSTWGLAQYVVAPMGVILSLVVLRSARRDRVVVGVSLTTALASAACMGMMFYRGYFSSLGW